MIARARIPNLLTGARVVAVGVALVCIEAAIAPLAPLLFWLFVAAAVTDFLDGYLARAWKVESAFGALMDPMADKLLVAVMLLYLLTQSAIPLLPVAIILLRELYLAGLREFLALRGIPLPVSRLGKWKTATQMLALAVLLGAMAYPLPAVFGTMDYASLGTGLLWFAAALALWSAVSYTVVVLRHPTQIR